MSALSTSIERQDASGDDEASFDRPITVLIGALGGEGGGVLSNWLTAAAQAEGFAVQATSVPGVAQRTGATTYYLELMRDGVDDDSPRGPSQRPIMALLPSPGNVDLVVASELLEAGRAAQNGMITADRTTVIASTHRFYAIAEKSAMGDGRFDTDRIIQTVNALAKDALLGDISEVSAQSGAVISAVMFGAICATGVVPVSRESMEEAIRRGGIAVETNLRGFEAGLQFVDALRKSEDPADRGDMAALGAATREEPLDDRIARLPEAVREFASIGVPRLVDYQNDGYAERYLDRVERILAIERTHAQGSRGYAVAADTARYLALWMSYEDVIRVADLKTRAERVQRVRAEVKASRDQPVVITDFLKPGLEEWTALMPPGLSRLVTKVAGPWQERLNVGLHIKSTSVSGFLLLWSLGRLRWWRRFTARFADEQTRIDRWLECVCELLAISYDAALEVVLCANLVKGYGDTHARGRGNFDRILGVALPCAAEPDGAAQLKRLREAALADPEGEALQRAFLEIESKKSEGGEVNGSN